MSREFGYTVSDETKQTISKSVAKAMKDPKLRQRISESVSKSMTKVWKDPEYRQKMSKVWSNPELTQQVSKSVSKTLTGHVTSYETRQKISNAQVGKTMSEESKQLMSESAKENWSNPEFKQRMLEGLGPSWHRRPNEPELQLQSVLDTHFPGEWEYVGDGTFWIDGRNPDFVNVDKKQIIEVFGYYWHDPDYFPNRPTEEELIAHHKQYGYDCIVLWEYDAYNEEEVVVKIKTFLGG